MSTTTSTNQPPDSIAALLKEAPELPDPSRSLLTHNEREPVRFCGWLAGALAAAEDRAAKLDEQLRPGSPTERAPTVWAYEQACKALEMHRDRADDVTAPANGRISKLLNRVGMLAGVAQYIKPGKPMATEIAQSIADEARHILCEMAEMGIRHIGISDAEHEALLAPANPVQVNDPKKSQSD